LQRERNGNKLTRTNRHLWIRFFVSPNGRIPSAQRLDLTGDEPAPPARLPRALRLGRRRHGPGPRQRDRVFVLLLHVPAPCSFRRLPERGPAPNPGLGRPRQVDATSGDGDGDGEGARDAALAIDEAVRAAERAAGGDGGGGRGGRAGARPRARAVGAEPEEAVAEAVRAHAAARQGRVPPAAPVVAGHRR
jgi:hypothetical protein